MLLITTASMVACIQLVEIDNLTYFQVAQWLNVVNSALTTAGFFFADYTS